MSISWVKAFETEHEIRRIINDQVTRGVKFNTPLALFYVDKLTTIQEEAYEEIRPHLRYELIDLGTVEKIRLNSGGYTKAILKYFEDDELLSWCNNDEMIAGPFTKIRIEEPTLSKRDMIVKQLLGMGWKPKLFTPTGKPKITDKGIPCESLEAIGDFGKALALYYTASHRKSQIEGLIKLVRPDGRIEAAMDTVGTNTARARHVGVVNIPRPSSFFGKEMRSMFCVEEGRALVGSDASGLELRCLAHYMNDPNYIDLILNGDIHEYNKNAAGLPTRDDAKTFIYALLSTGSFKW